MRPTTLLRTDTGGQYACRVVGFAASWDLKTAKLSRNDVKEPTAERVIERA